MPGRDGSFTRLEIDAQYAIATVLGQLRTAGVSAAGGTFRVRVEWVPAAGDAQAAELAVPPIAGIDPITERTPPISLGGGWSTCRAATGAWIVESRAYAGLIWASLTLDGRIGWGTADGALEPDDGWRAAALWRIRWAGEVQWLHLGSSEERAAFYKAESSAVSAVSSAVDGPPPCPRCPALAAELDELRGLLLEAEAGEDF